MKKTKILQETALRQNRNEREISIKHRRTGLESVLPLPLLSFHTLPPALLSRPGVYPHLIGRRPSHAHLHAANPPPCSALLVFTAPLLPALALPYLFISPAPPSPPFLHLRYQPPHLIPAPFFPPSFLFLNLPPSFLPALLCRRLFILLCCLLTQLSKSLFPLYDFSSSPLLSLFLVSHCSPFLFSLPSICSESFDLSLMTTIFSQKLVFPFHFSPQWLCL